jgi:hypothetical protein
LGTGTTSVFTMNLSALNGGGFLFGCDHVRSFYQIAASSASFVYLKCIQLSVAVNH